MLTGLTFLDARERFLPVSLAALCERILSDPRLSDEERQQFRRLADMAAARLHVEFREKLERLKTLYEPFDPDCDTLTCPDAAAAEPGRREDLVRAFDRLLMDANYVEMPREQIIACAEYQARTGLVVEAFLDDYAELRVFYRGVRHAQRSFRPWLAPWKCKHETIHVFARVAALVRLAKSPDRPAFIKLFKNVAAEDLEMLLPYVRIRMRLLDHVKIGSSVAGGLATAGWKALTAVIISPALFLLIMSAFIGAAIRGVFSFLSCKTRYMQALTANLYFQNLANNSSAIAHLVDTAEMEECKEFLLAYYLLYVERGRELTQEQLDSRAEQWLRAEFALDVDFEVFDAVRKLRDGNLLVCRAPTAPGLPETAVVLRVYDLPSTLRRLDESWDRYYPYSQRRTANDDRLAEGDWPPCAGASAEDLVQPVAHRKTA